MNKFQYPNSIYFRITFFVLSICFFCLLVADIVIFKKNELPKISNTNLGLLINAIIENFNTALVFSCIPLFASLCTIFLVYTFYKDINNPFLIKMLVFSYIGMFPLFLGLSLILLATKPSDTTIVFTIFSYIGATILYISTLYSKLKK